MFTKSIRWRVQLWQAFLLICVLTGFGVTAYQLNHTNRFKQIDDELERRIAALGSDVRGLPPFGPPRGRPRIEPGLDFPPPLFPEPGGFKPDGPGPDGHGPGGRGPGGHRPMERFKEGLENREIRLSPRTANLFTQTETNDFYYAVWSQSGSLMKQSTNLFAGTSRPQPSEKDTTLHRQTRLTCREVFQYTELGECLLVGRCVADDLNALQRFAGWLVAAGGAVLALGLGGGWWVASRAIRPVEEIGTIASRISAGSLSERINLADTDSELGRLAGVLNTTFARLEAAFAQQKQFTADASHELRTPLAVIISEAQTTLARERTAAEYRETLEGCLETAQQMRRLTQSLLELARFDAGQEPFERHPVDLAELALACVELVGPLARERGVEIHTDLASAVTLGDTDRLGQVITNLLTNAIHYNKDRGKIRVATRAEHDMAVVTVTDTGLGITPEALPHIFKRFYRADTSRTRAHGRNGLGLAICKAIVDVHGGRIEVSSDPGAGSVFSVKLPLKRKDTPE